MIDVLTMLSNFSEEAWFRNPIPKSCNSYTRSHAKKMNPIYPDIPLSKPIYPHTSPYKLIRSYMTLFILYNLIHAHILMPPYMSPSKPAYRYITLYPFVTLYVPIEPYTSLYNRICPHPVDVLLWLRAGCQSHRALVWVLGSRMV